MKSEHSEVGLLNLVWLLLFAWLSLAFRSIIYMGKEIIGGKYIGYR